MFTRLCIFHDDDDDDDDDDGDCDGDDDDDDDDDDGPCLNTGQPVDSIKVQ